MDAITTRPTQTKDPRDTEIRLLKTTIKAQRDREDERYRSPRFRARRWVQENVTALRAPDGKRLRRATVRAVLIAIADAIDSDTGACIASYAEIAERADMGRRTVMRVVLAAKAAGALQVVRRRVSRTVNLSNEIRFTDVTQWGGNYRH